MDDVNNAYIDVIARMLTWNPNERITADEALKHDEFADFEGGWIPEAIAYQHQARPLRTAGKKVPRMDWTSISA
jgi:serine/threonine protein kinase